MKLNSKLIGLIVLFSSSSLFSQVSPKDLLKAWDSMTEMVVKTAEAMSAENYTFKPTEELRDFANQIEHTLKANYMFASTVKLENPKLNLPSTKDKEIIIKELKKSFVFIRNGVKNLTVNDLNEKFKFFGKEASRLQAILIMTSHTQRENGKTKRYVRLKNSAPARSGGW